jgi:hypothetical protein
MIRELGAAAARGPSRRAVAAGLSAAAYGGAAAAKAASVKDLATYSESAMVMSISPDGRSAMTLRFCRFPEAGVTWLWCHLVKDGEMFAYTRHDLPCTADRRADKADTQYDVPGVQAALRRAGQGHSLEAVSVSGELGFHQGTAAPLGDGRLRGSLMGVFTPTHVLGAAVAKDRDEVYGDLVAKLAVGPNRWSHEGPAKFLEQRQTGPRFGPPFSYGWLAGPDAAATTLLVQRGASGGWVVGGAEEALADMALDPPGAERAVAYRLKSGRRLDGRLSAIVRYEIPIFDRHWQGSFVQGMVGGIPVVGAMNDWTTEPDIYAAATSRNR